MHIASFAGFAPVNNPVIAVAVVIDSPKGAYYGAAVSAPVFAEVAQQVLEYLGVPHDIDLRPAATASKKDAPVTEDDSSAQGKDIQALYDAANDLPSDDPLRAAPSQTTPATHINQAANSSAKSKWRFFRCARIFRTFSSRLRQTSRPLPIRSSSPAPGNCACLPSSACPFAR